MKYELHPCPFCGSSDISLNVGEHNFEDVKIRCENCNVEGPIFDEFFDGMEKESAPVTRNIEQNKAAAIKHWNTRAS